MTRVIVAASMSAGRRMSCVEINDALGLETGPRVGRHRGAALTARRVPNGQHLAPTTLGCAG